MTRPTPEYDIGVGTATQAEKEFRKMKEDPGIPDEMVTEMSEEPREVIDINIELWAEAAPFGAAVIVTIVVVEMVKGLGLRNVMRGLEWTEQRKKTAYRWVTSGVACATSLTFGFSDSVLNLTGVRLSLFESVLYGTASVALAAHTIYKLRLVQVLKVRAYRFLQVDETDLQSDSEAHVDE